MTCHLGPLQADELRPFDTFGLGHAAFERPEVLEGLVESIRTYMEECDNPQGFQV